jgi:hypothetical protein
MKKAKTRSNPAHSRLQGQTRRRVRFVSPTWVGQLPPTLPAALFAKDLGGLCRRPPKPPADRFAPFGFSVPEGLFKGILSKQCFPLVLSSQCTQPKLAVNPQKYIFAKSAKIYF